MVVNQKPSGRAASMPAGLMTGLGIGIGITLLLCAVSAVMVDTGWIEEKDIGYCAMVILISAPFAGASTAQKRIKRQRLAVCGIFAALYFLVLMGITALLFGGQFEAVGVTLLLIVCGSVLPLLIGERRNRGGKQRKRKMRNC